MSGGVSPYSVFICPHCAGKFKEVREDEVRKYLGQLITVKNVPMAKCVGEVSKGRPGCGHIEIISSEVTRGVYELIKEAARKGKTEIKYEA